MEIRATVSETTQRYFACQACGAKGEVEFRARGDSGWQSGSLILDVEPADAVVVAGEDMMKDASRVLGLVKCPTCKQRDARAVRWARIRVGAWFAGGGLLALVGGLYAMLGAAAMGLLGAWQTYSEVSRYKRADAARILRLKPGTLPPLPELPPVQPPPPKLPTARAITAPPLQPIAPRGPDEEPAFLRKR